MERYLNTIELIWGSEEAFEVESEVHAILAREEDGEDITCSLEPVTYSSIPQRQIVAHSAEPAPRERTCCRLAPGWIKGDWSLIKGA